MYWVFLYIWIGMAFVVFPILLKRHAPYGRHTAQKWGKVISNRQGWFWMEIPALIIFPALYFIGNGFALRIELIFVTLYLIHYIHRTFIFPFKIKKSKSIPVLIVVLAVIFNIINGIFLGYYFGFNSNLYSAAWYADPRFFLGIALFVSGMFINIWHDNVLINLRTSPQDTYKVPKGALFEYVSCPNHFGEIVEWIGFAVLTWSLPALAFAIWTAANLIPRSLNHHQWYQDRFENYPEERKAVIPFVL